MKDIVCGKDVSNQTPFKATHGDRPFYFCSKVCETSFVNNPTRFIEKTGSAIGSTEGSPKTSASGEKMPSRS